MESFLLNEHYVIKNTKYYLLLHSIFDILGIFEFSFELVMNLFGLRNYDGSRD